MRNLFRILLIKKIFFNPIGITVLIVTCISILTMAFTAFPKNGGFDLDNPDSNKDFLEDDDSNSGRAKCSQDGEIDENAMEGVFSGAGVFDAMETDFVDIATENEIDPILFSAIAIHETGYGTSDMVKEKNNPGGLFDSQANEFFHFDTLHDGLDAMASNLYDNYYAMGLFTIPDIGEKYAPPGAENDPDNINIHWVPNVTSITNDLGGLVMYCELMEDGDFVFPVDNPVINSPYGHRIHPIHGDLRLHAGTDFDCDYGDQIYSVQNGEIVETRSETGGLGNFVIVEHQEDKYTVYAHLDEISTSEGDQVSAGEKVGMCGTTGTSTGTHLHLEVRLGSMYGDTVDPENYLPPID